ncbi:MAG: hypothetical protein Q8L98_04180 [Chlamydiales bacterium]|nr:hypothetical protein [Chlamydiales bacterium]
MSIDLYINMINNEYPSSQYKEEPISEHSKKILKNNGFIGSRKAVILSSADSIIFNPLTCLAAPRISLVAENAIYFLGKTEFPVFLYPPERLRIGADRLIVGDIEMLTDPKEAYISCKILAFVQSTEQEHSSFEIVKSWVVNDDVEIETIRL